MMLKKITLAMMMLVGSGVVAHAGTLTGATEASAAVTISESTKLTNTLTPVSDLKDTDIHKDITIAHGVLTDPNKGALMAIILKGSNETGDSKYIPIVDVKGKNDPSHTLTIALHSTDGGTNEDSIKDSNGWNGLAQKSLSPDGTLKYDIDANQSVVLADTYTISTIGYVKLN